MSADQQAPQADQNRLTAYVSAITAQDLAQNRPAPFATFANTVTSQGTPSLTACHIPVQYSGDTTATKM